MKDGSVRKVVGLVAALCVATSWVPFAEASIPTYQERVDGKEFARYFWDDRGVETVCYGVRIRFRALQSGIVAAVPGNRNGTSKCAIVFNKRIDWGRNQGWGRADPWWRFCRIAIHEYGHLPGMPFEFPPLHSRNANSIMASSEQQQAEGARWWPYFPACRYDGDDQDGDGEPDW
jgi:hypothetical protein